MIVTWCYRTTKQVFEKFREGNCPVPPPGCGPDRPH